MHMYPFKKFEKKKRIANRTRTPDATRHRSSHGDDEGLLAQPLRHHTLRQLGRELPLSPLHVRLAIDEKHVCAQQVVEQEVALHAALVMAVLAQHQEALVPPASPRQRCHGPTMVGGRPW
jgi:hypothetical protein